jgi:hypothetical protein
MPASVQRISLTRPAVETTSTGAAALADAYWAEIDRLTGGLVRIHRTGADLELRLAGLIPLLRFGAPRLVAHEELVACVFPITGGVLAKEERGTLAFTQRSEPDPELVVSVEDYIPRLSSRRERWSIRRAVYREVQERVHTAIGWRYLARMAGGSR